jgi:dTDP-4-amino-4,6-dideoxygalactose transaminase
VVAKKYPFLQPRPPRLSELGDELREIEASGVYSNFGPLSRRAENALVEGLFDGVGAALLVANATLGLMIAIREAAGRSRVGGYALMPAYCFAATAQAALWAGLTPLLCDIDPGTWSASAAAEDELLERYGDQVKCVVPYSCFGGGLDEARYRRLHESGMPIVVDAAASLGWRNERGGTLGSGAPFATIYSMHVTKTFATGEAGLIYSSHGELIERLRSMANFGFDDARVVQSEGLNAKATEHAALLVLQMAARLDAVAAHRSMLAERYRERLPRLGAQSTRGAATPYQFMPLLLPTEMAPRRDAIVMALAARDIEARTYFSPHLAQHPYIAQVSVSGDLTTTDDVAARSLSLPLAEDMALTDVDAVAAALNEILDAS